jgi:broad specificity phosphatase PhoE
MPFTLVRHGHWYCTEDGRFRGHGHDLVPLSTEGVRDAERAARQLLDQQVDLILSSPMTRALQTAMVMSWSLGVRVDVDLDLHEWTPDRDQQWVGIQVPTAAYTEMTALGGEWPASETRSWEPLSDVRARVTAVLDRYADRGHVVVVSHSVVIQAMTGVEDISHGGVVALNGVSY